MKRKAEEHLARVGLAARRANAARMVALDPDALRRTPEQWHEAHEASRRGATAAAWAQQRAAVANGTARAFWERVGMR